MKYTGLTFAVFQYASMRNAAAWVPTSSTTANSARGAFDIHTRVGNTGLFSTNQDNNHEGLIRDHILQGCQRNIACGIASALVMLSSPMNSHAAMSQTATYVDHDMPTNRLSNQQYTSFSSPASASYLALSLSSQLLSSETEEQGAVVEEVWKLVDKYYIDRTFNGQDWSKVKDTYVGRAQKNGDEMKLVKEMVQSLGDKYSRTLDVQQYTAIQKYDLIGVGVTLMPNPEKEIIVGAPPIAGSAAEKAGMKVGDKVVAVNGLRTKGRTAFDIIDQISENPNARTISMTLQSATTGEEEREVTMDRLFQEIKNPVRFKISEERKDGTKVGFIRISEFNSLVKANLEQALDSLKQQGANAYVIDLRMNGGGAFQSAVEISSLFFENRIATYVVDGSTAVLPFKSASGQQIVPPEDPVVLWVDGGSASATEVLAGSLHDNCKAVVMGDKSFGKGLIQAVYGLKNGAGLVLTVAKYVTPNQNEIQGIGITPDIPGKNILPPLLPGGLGGGSDTSKVDFADIKTRLSSNYCSIPEQREQLSQK